MGYWEGSGRDGKLYNDFQSIMLTWGHFVRKRPLHMLYMGEKTVVISLERTDFIVRVTHGTVF